MKEAKEITIGSMVQEPFTGFTGMVVGKLEMMGQTVRWAVQGKVLTKEKTPTEPLWIPGERLVVKVGREWSASAKPRQTTMRHDAKIPA